MKKDGTPTKREVQLGAAKRAGYHDDVRALVRLIVERQGVKQQDIRAAYDNGRALKASGYKCECFFCKREVGVP